MKIKEALLAAALSTIVTGPADAPPRVSRYKPATEATMSIPVDESADIKFVEYKLPPTQNTQAKRPLLVKAF